MVDPEDNFALDAIEEFYWTTGYASNGTLYMECTLLYRDLLEYRPYIR